MILIKYITKPENTGMVKLSFIGIGIISIIAAINEPIKIISWLISKLSINEIDKHATKHPMKPEKVFLPILIKGSLVPTIAANVSPKDKNSIDKIEYGYGINIIVNKNPTKTHVAPV